MLMGNLWCWCGAVPALSPVKDENKGEAARCQTAQQKDHLLHLSLFPPSLGALHHLLTLVGLYLGCDNCVGHIPGCFYPALNLTSNNYP